MTELLAVNSRPLIISRDDIGVWKETHSKPENEFSNILPGITVGSLPLCWVNESIDTNKPLVNLVGIVCRVLLTLNISALNTCLQTHYPVSPILTVCSTSGLTRHSLYSVPLLPCVVWTIRRDWTIGVISVQPRCQLTLTCPQHGLMSSGHKPMRWTLSTPLQPLHFGVWTR